MHRGLSGTRVLARQLAAHVPKVSETAMHAVKRRLSALANRVLAGGRQRQVIGASEQDTETRSVFVRLLSPKPPASVRSGGISLKEFFMRKTLALLAVCLLAGCAGTPVGDALIGPEKLAQQDDAYCRSIGAVGPNYTNCRLFMTKDRADRHTAAINSAADSFQRAGDSFQRTGPNVTCTTTGPNSRRTTTCD